MCVSLAMGTLIATAVSGAVATYGAYAQGKAQEAQNKYAAAVAEQQAKLTKQTAEQNVSLVQEEGKFATKELRRRVAAIEGEQKGVLAAQGVGGGSVTAADIATSTFDTAKLDELAIRYNTESKAWGIRNNAMYQTWDLESQKRGYLMAGKNAARAGLINAGATLLGTASSVGDKYLTYQYYKKIGVPGIA